MRYQMPANEEKLFLDPSGIGEYNKPLCAASVSCMLTAGLSFRHGLLSAEEWPCEMD